jgi:hypothetical protein
VFVSALLFFFANVYVRSYIDCMVVQFRLLPFEIIYNPVGCETFEVQLVCELKTNCNVFRQAAYLVS